MNNYEYIIASLPVPDRAEKLDPEAIIAEIRSQCSDEDNALVDLLLDSFESGNLDRGFYVKALSSRNPFIRDYLGWDLRVRNAKAEYLCGKLGLPADQDTIDLPGSLEFDGRERVDAVLSGTDILAREKGLDDLMWEKAEELTMMHVFDIDVILSFIARIKITDRWNKLDPEKGRSLFRNLVEEIRKTR